MKCIYDPNCVDSVLTAAVVSMSGCKDFITISDLSDFESCDGVFVIVACSLPLSTLMSLRAKAGVLHVLDNSQSAQDFFVACPYTNNMHYGPSTANCIQAWRLFPKYDGTPPDIIKYANVHRLRMTVPSLVDDVAMGILVQGHNLLRSNEFLFKPVKYFGTEGMYVNRVRAILSARPEDGTLNAVLSDGTIVALIAADDTKPRKLNSNAKNADLVISCYGQEFGNRINFIKWRF